MPKIFISGLDDQKNEIKPRAVPKQIEKKTNEQIVKAVIRKTDQIGHKLDSDY